MTAFGRGPLLIPSLTRDTAFRVPNLPAASGQPRPSRPLSSPRPFLLLVFVLLILALFLDLSLTGPLTDWAATVIVVAPVEAEWGFHAEWRSYPLWPRFGEVLTVVSVVPGGAFDRSGVKVGDAFAPRTCGFNAPFFADGHSAFFGASSEVFVRMLPATGPPWPVSRRIQRPASAPRH